MRSEVSALLVAVFVSIPGCAGGPSLGMLPPPTLSGDYELIGPFSRDGADPESPYVVTFLGDDMYSFVQEGQIGRSPAPARYRTSGNTVTFSLNEHEIRVRMLEDNTMVAEVHGRYVASERREKFCRAYSSIDSSGRRSCIVEDERRVPTYARYTREVTFRRASH